MVGVHHDTVLARRQPLDELLQFGVGEGDVGCPEGGYDVDAVGFEGRTLEHDGDGPLAEPRLTQRIHLGVVVRKEGRDAISTLRREASVEPLGVGTEDGRIELVATHNEDRFVRDRCSSDTWGRLRWHGDESAKRPLTRRDVNTAVVGCTTVLKSSSTRP